VARIRARKQKFQSLTISMERGLTSRFADATGARDAARIATKAAREGWNAEVYSFPRSGYNPGRKHVKMTCQPVHDVTGHGPKVKAACTITPAFKKQIKGL
jgi:hypothetical protein